MGLISELLSYGFLPDGQATVGYALNCVLNEQLVLPSCLRHPTTRAHLHIWISSIQASVIIYLYN